jgi:monofunctional biosynthetic peptidoglycan transglycosylase
MIWSGPEEAAPAPPPAPDTPPARETTLSDVGAGIEPLVYSQPQPDYVGSADFVGAADSAAAEASQPVMASRNIAIPSPAVPSAVLAYLMLAMRAAALLAAVFAAAIFLLTVLYRWVDPPASTLMLMQRLAGTEIEQRWVPLGRISPHLVQAVILSEDASFCRHRGVDWLAVEEAIENSRGGSTITMQVVKNLFLWSSRSYLRKAIEIPLAYLVELFWPKRRILEIYLNIAEWGEGVFGAEAAARHHFGKAASQLAAQEAALLAVALPNPLERQPGEPGPLMRRLAGNLLTRMKAVRTTMSCVRAARASW